MCVGDVDVNVAAGSAHERGIEVLRRGTESLQGLGKEFDILLKVVISVFCLRAECNCLSKQE